MFCTDLFDLHEFYFNESIIQCSVDITAIQYTVRSTNVIEQGNEQHDTAQLCNKIYLVVYLMMYCNKLH